LKITKMLAGDPSPVLYVIPCLSWLVLSLPSLTPEYAADS